MKRAVKVSQSWSVRIYGVGAMVAALATASVLVAQQNSVAPQPQLASLPAPGSASPKPSRPVQRPEGMMPSAPGFTVSSYAELQFPRMMVYAPNGDLFVSSPGTNTITVLRDVDNDGVFEARGVYASAPIEPPPAGGG